MRRVPREEEEDEDEGVLEDEYGAFDDEDSNKQFLSVMHLLHTKDPKIYDKKSSFFKGMHLHFTQVITKSSFML